MRRRTLLKLGATSAAVLLVAGGAAALLKPGLEGGALSPAGREVFAAIGRAILDKSVVVGAEVHLGDGSDTRPNRTQPRNLQSGITVVGNMPEDSVEGADAAGPPDHPQMQSDRHHFRGVRPLAMQPSRRRR